jgi:hypothetical protein
MRTRRPYEMQRNIDNQQFLRGAIAFRGLDEAGRSV